MPCVKCNGPLDFAINGQVQDVCYACSPYRTNLRGCVCVTSTYDPQTRTLIATSETYRPDGHVEIRREVQTDVAGPTLAWEIAP